MKSVHQLLSCWSVGCLYLSLIHSSLQAYPTVPLQAWLPKTSADATPVTLKKLSSSISSEFDSILFPSDVQLNTLCQLESPIIYVKQNIHYTDFSKANTPASVQWIKDAQSKAKYALDVGYIASDVTATLETKLKAVCPGKSLKRVSFLPSARASEFQALSAANPQSFIVFSGILSDSKSVLDKYEFFTPTLFMTFSVSIFLVIITCISISFVSSVQVGIGVDRPQRKQKQQ